MKRLYTAIAVLLFTVTCSTFNSPAMAQTTQEIVKGNCDSCSSTCEHTLTYCTVKKGQYDQAAITTALKDCITACKMTADFLSRGSALEPKSADICIAACDTCVKSCESFSGDNNMTACADECRKCASNLQKLAVASK